ncbi:MAG: FTR1 family protein [Oscillospiraceae bacterium]|nr:FTR1 family protein [Oscillospiraceae bacterium]
MMLTKKRPFNAVSMLVLTMLFLLSSFSGLTAFAAGEYIATWDEYKNAGGASSSWNDVANAMDDVLEAADALYQNGDAGGAHGAVNAAYYGYYETTGFERVAMGYIAGSRKTEVELQFSSCKTVTKNGGSTDEFFTELSKLSEMLHTDANKLDGVGDTGTSGLSREGEVQPAEENADASADNAVPETQTETASAIPAGNAVSVGGGGGGMVTFIACLGIIVREGLEAILVVGAIIAYLVKSGNKDKLKFVYTGCVLAIGASFLCAWLLSLLKLANSANQEIIEGITALIAVLVLFYVSNWMVSKAESEAWTKYIDEQIKVSAETGNVFTLAFTAFLAVFREGAEVILFYQPLLSDDPKYVWGGFALGCVILVFVFLAIRFLSVKLPIRPFFLGTSILMFIMSISFLGSGIKELIEGDVMTMTSPAILANLIPTNNVFDVLGIYPCLETLIPQLILIFITIMIFVMQKWNSRNRKEAGILAIVLGGLGIHKFYLGKYGKGLIYVATCWSGIPFLISIGEGIHFLTESDEQFEEELKPKPKKIKPAKK